MWQHQPKTETDARADPLTNFSGSNREMFFSTGPSGNKHKHTFKSNFENKNLTLVQCGKVLNDLTVLSATSTGLSAIFKLLTVIVMCNVNSFVSVG